MFRLTIIGNVGNDANVSEYNGQGVINFNVAHSERYRDAQGQQQERTTWVRCSYWRELGKTSLAQYLLKGKKVYVEGVPSIHQYTDKDGKSVAMLELRVTHVELLTASDKDNAAPAPAPAAMPAKGNTLTENEDDLPF